MMPCPFCQADLSEYHAYNVALGIDFTILTVSLCTHCGEPLIIERDGYRKPTPDEYVMVNDDRLKAARRAWLDIQKNTRPPISAMFEAWWSSKLEGQPLRRIVDTDEKMKTFVQDIFMSGVTLSMSLFQDASDVESQEEFDAKMAIIHMEIKAYGEFAEERRRAGGHGTPDRKGNGEGAA